MCKKQAENILRNIDQCWYYKIPLLLPFTHTQTQYTKTVLQYMTNTFDI